VLVITGSDPYLPAFVALDSAMRAAVARNYSRPVSWLHESMDTTRLRGEPGPLLAELLARKYEQVRIDAVILVTEPAVDFYFRHRDRLWPEAAVVYHAVTPAFAQGRTFPASTVGLPLAVDHAGTLELALALQPGARRVLVVGGASLFDQQQLAEARPALDQIARRVPVEVLSGPSPRAIAERLARESPDTIVLYLSIFRDAEGSVHTPREVLRTLSAASAAPLYGVFDSYIGHGLAAGAVESFAARGERVAELLLRAMRGEFAGGAVIDTPPKSRCVADARQLLRLGLRARMLPSDCDVRFSEPSLLRTYWWQLMLVALALVGQGLLITGLLLQRRRRREAEMGLAAQRVQLLHASRLAVAGEMTASIAHEINQPLGAILSNAEAAEMMLQAGSLDRAGLLQILADIRRDDLRASEVIKRLRALLARHEVERRRFDLNRTIEEVLAILRAEARRRETPVDVELTADGTEVVGDPVQIQQVIINLLLNAFDACAELPAAQRRVRIATSATPAGVQLTVADSGCGIGADVLPRLFDPFFSTKGGGMGLGLSIARSIVEAHGGTISAASSGQGAQFRLVLPAAPPAGATAEPAAPAASTAGSSTGSSTDPS
jgi:signal transduction histidine kinase